MFYNIYPWSHQVCNVLIEYFTFFSPVRVSSCQVRKTSDKLARFSRVFGATKYFSLLIGSLSFRLLQMFVTEVDVSLKARLRAKEHL
jgi:hypothetical protein